MPRMCRRSSGYRKHKKDRTVIRTGITIFIEGDARGQGEYSQGGEQI